MINGDRNVKIINIVLNGNFTDGMAYQENCLPYYQRKVFDADVAIIAGQYELKKGTNESEIVPAGRSICQNGIPLIRIPSSKNRILKRFSYYPTLYEELKKEKPDIIFAHLIQSLSLCQIIRYKKENPATIIYADSHADYVNSANNWFSKNIIHKILWKRIIQSSEAYIEQFYGVLPLRVKFLKEMYSIPENKVQLLLMGAEDDLVINDAQIRNNIRNQFGIAQEDFVVITGGKIDKKKNIHLLIEAIKKINDSHIKLFIFGKADGEVKEYISNLRETNNIFDLGWISPTEMYKYFCASDLTVFPGTHSVLWEQSLGAGLPGLFKYWDGIDHIDGNGNVCFLYEDSLDEIERKLRYIFINKEYYRNMKNRAEEVAKEFLYTSIAKQSIKYNSGAKNSNLMEHNDVVI